MRLPDTLKLVTYVQLEVPRQRSTVIRLRPNHGTAA